MLARNKLQVLSQVERQGKVGEGLNRLKIARQQIDQTLQETQEFNERILDPEKWNKRLRER